MRETHPFGNFVPKNSKYLVLGSFIAAPSENYDWFYSNGRNQFWSIIEKVYKVDLETKVKKKELFRKLKIAVADIIYSCERRKKSSLDTNLINIVYNFKGIEKILKENKIEKIFFTSKFVETTFKKQFSHLIHKHPKIELIYLPSPSPRYATMSKDEKVRIYKKLLPEPS